MVVVAAPVTDSALRIAFLPAGALTAERVVPVVAVLWRTRPRVVAAEVVASFCFYFEPM